MQPMTLSTSFHDEQTSIFQDNGNSLFTDFMFK